MGLLDTGVRSTHTLFLSGYLNYLRDCVNGDSNCNGGNPTDDYPNGGHGTSSSAILVGNDSYAGRFRGVCGANLDSWKVYNPFLNRDAVVRAFQAALSAGDNVIVAEMQDTASPTDTDAVASSANNAFDAGAVVIAANGNFGPSAGTVNSPASAHKVIGVGAVYYFSLATPSYQSLGPAPDGRIKPDIQAPTFTETATNESDNSFNNFDGTSGATPYAGGVASLFRNWLYEGARDPGQVYAYMILAGQQPSFDNTHGAGLLKMPNTYGQEFYGKVSVSDSQTIDIPLNLSWGSPNRLDGALWWPESATQSHNDVNVYLINPSGVQMAASTSVLSVFERVRVSGNISYGTWTLRIIGNTVPAGPQTVYWAVRAHQQ